MTADDQRQQREKKPKPMTAPKTSPNTTKPPLKINRDHKPMPMRLDLRQTIKDMRAEWLADPRNQKPPAAS